MNVFWPADGPVAVMALLAVMMAAALENPSVFLDRKQYEAVIKSGSLSCTFRVVSPGSNDSTTSTLSFPTFDVSRRLAKLASQDVPEARYKNKKRTRTSTHLTIITDDNSMTEALQSLPMSANATFYALKTTTDTDMLCLEMIIITHNIDIVMPLSVQAVLRLSKKLKHPQVLERHFGIAVLLPPYEFTTIATSDAALETWMKKNQLRIYGPNVYTTQNEYKCPCVIKPTGTESELSEATVVRTLDQLKRVIPKSGTGFLVEEAISGQFEITIAYFASSGILDATLCIVNDEKERLFLRSGDRHNNGSTSKIVPCGELHQNAPIFDLVSRIVSLSLYHGFGCIKFKLTPGRRLNQRDINSFLEKMDNTTLFSTTFGRSGIIDLPFHDAYPRIIDYAPVACADLVRMGGQQLIEMIRLFVDAKEPNA